MSQYNVYTLTTEQLTDMIASGDDTKSNQIRIKEDGTIFLSTVVGLRGLNGIICRFETFDAYNGYVGKKAASDSQYIRSLFLTIQHWIDNPVSYVDCWIQE